jgi:hypothetical protein
MKIFLAVPSSDIIVWFESGQYRYPDIFGY